VALREKEREIKREREKMKKWKETPQQSGLILLMYFWFSRLNEYFTSFFSIIVTKY
jgi:hypothetical protein